MKQTTKYLIITSLLFLSPFLSFGAVYASENQFVTIVNPVRIAPYTKNVSENIAVEYKVMKDLDSPATWLLTFDVLEDKNAVTILKGMDKQQELGLFLEIGSKLCQSSGVICNEGSWHHANVIFLSGYTQGDRKKLIDTLFGQFHETFGYYPTSVGSWWTDSYSLDYMHERYGVSANLTCSDQFLTDGYQLWGQYWSLPFYSSIYHSGIPAPDTSIQSPVVTIQWAPRDPLNGYLSSLYSTQDYKTNPVNLDTSYFKKLVDLYAYKNSNSYGQVTIGLEADLSKEAYEDEYKNQMEYVATLSRNQIIRNITMKEFSEWYREKFKETPVTVVETKDLLGKKQRVLWYQSKHYRLGLRYNETTKETTIFDFRKYHKDMMEPFYEIPNSEHQLAINIFSQLDEISNSKDVWQLKVGKMKDIQRVSDNLYVIFENGKIDFFPEKVEMLDHGRKTTHMADVGYLTPLKGETFKGLTESATHELMRKRTDAFIVLGVLILLVFSALTLKSSLKLSWKIVTLVCFYSLCIFYSYGWYNRNSTTYFVSQGEVEALTKLSNFPRGIVMVYDRECLGCAWNGTYTPAAFANKRSYVKEYSKHSIIYNKTVFEAANQEIAKQEFTRLGAKYIYVTKYQNAIEHVPFSPGDLNIEKIYANANAEVWKVKDK